MNECSSCGKEATEFSHPLKEREFKLSRLCEKCQDKTFGKRTKAQLDAQYKIAQMMDKQRGD